MFLEVLVPETSFLSSLTAPFIMQLALKFAPGSTANLLTWTSPSTCADPLKLNISETVKVPLNLPSKSAFLQTSDPSTLPVFPITILPVVDMEPFTWPSILKSP